MCRLQKIAEIGAARRKCAHAITHVGDRPGHVEGSPDGDAVAQMFGQDAGIVGVVVRPGRGWASLPCLPVPAAGPSDRWCKTDEGHSRAWHRRAGCNDRCPSCWARRFRGLNARPRDGKPIALLVKTAWPAPVLRVEVVLVAGHIARRSALHFAGSVREPIPDGFALAIFLPRALHLVGGGGRAPQEAIGENAPAVSLSQKPRREFVL